MRPPGDGSMVHKLLKKKQRCDGKDPHTPPGGGEESDESRGQAL